MCIPVRGIPLAVLAARYGLVQARGARYGLVEARGTRYGLVPARDARYGLARVRGDPVSPRAPRSRVLGPPLHAHRVNDILIALPSNNTLGCG